MNDSVKISNGKPNQNEFRSFGQECYCPTIASQLQTQQEETNLTLQVETTIPGKEHTFPYVHGNSLATEKPPYFELPLQSKGLFLCHSLPNLPFLLKNSSPPISSVPWTCLRVLSQFVIIFYS